MLTPERTPDWDFLIDKVVQPRLEAVDGVGRVEVWGLLDETLRVWFDRDKLIAHRVDYRELLRRLGSDNFAEPIGEVDDGCGKICRTPRPSCNGVPLPAFMNGAEDVCGACQGYGEIEFEGALHEDLCWESVL